MKKSLMAVILLSASMCGAQSHYSEILPFDGYPNCSVLFEQEDVLVIGSINFIEVDGEAASSTSILTFDPETNEIARRDYVGRTIARKGLVKTTSGYLLYGRSFLENQHRIFTAQLDNDFTLGDTQFHFTTSGEVFPSTSIVLGGDFYGASGDKTDLPATDPGYYHESTLFKFDSAGNELWQQNFDQDGERTFITELDTTVRGELLAGMTHRPDGDYTSRATVKMITSDGEALWTQMSEEEPAHGAVLIHVEELSNGEILAVHRVDRWLDLDIIANGWHRLPHHFQWLDSNGSPVREHLFVVPEVEDVWFLGFKRALRDDAFFGYGTYLYDEFPRDSTVALLTKYDNMGDTIWTRSYIHPDYRAIDDEYRLKHIIEHENGDITCLAEITPVGGVAEIWIFRVGADGCPYGELGCDMGVVVSSTDAGSEVLDEMSLVVYPNPAGQYLRVRSQSRVKSYEVLNMAGESIMQSEYGGENIDISSLSPALYIIQVVFENGLAISKKFARE